MTRAIRRRPKQIMLPSAKKRGRPSEHRSSKELTERSTHKDANVLPEGIQAHSHEERHRCNNHIGPFMVVTIKTAILSGVTT
jgi:hypothetical protein